MGVDGIVSRITSRRHRGSDQLGLDGSVADQPRKNPGHRLTTLAGNITARGCRSHASARYGELVNSAPVRRGRVRDFVRWVARTPWPVFALGMLQANIIGALVVLGFLRFGLPPTDRIRLQDLPTLNMVVLIGYVLTAIAVGLFLNLRLLAPVFRWQRRDTLLTSANDDDPSATEQARLRALRMPHYRSVITMSSWLVGSVVLIVASRPVAEQSVPVLAVATLLGAIADTIIGYLQAERVLRPVAVAALRGGIPDGFRRPGLVQRLVLTWVLSTGCAIPPRRRAPPGCRC